jgi:putative aldouronate transport system permease protein
MRPMQNNSFQAYKLYAQSSKQRPSGTYRGMFFRARQKISIGIVHAILIVLSLLFVLPLVIVVSGSLSSEKDISLYGYSLVPQHISLAAYQFLFQDPNQILDAYGVSIFVTVVGSAISLLVMALLGYVISRRDFKYRRGLSFFSLFPLLFNGGLVPIYLIMTQLLHVQDTLLAYILPYLVLPFYVLLLRTYFSGLPTELIEAAKLDGASEWRIFFQIVVPLSTPALATVGLFSMLTYWNDWFQGLLYASSPHIFSLQYLLYQIQQNITVLATSASASDVSAVAIPSQSVLMAMAVVAIGPIVLAFLFTQRYFVRGITLGGIKGE